MRYPEIIPVAAGIVLACIAASLFAQEKTDEGPTSQKAQKAYQEAQEYLRQHRFGSALGDFKKADKLDNGRCLACQKKMVQYGIQVQDWKTAEGAADEMVAQAHDARGISLGHFEMGVILMSEAAETHGGTDKDDLFTRAHEEMLRALAPAASFPRALYADGIILAHLHQDDAARARFEEFVKLRSQGDPDRPDPDRQRALRYIGQPALARAPMTPPFAITTTDGQRISMDDLAGKVVLLDFWATWCAPCRQAIPHLRDIVKEFRGQPLVVLSINLDRDEKEWKEFVAQNEMTWLQYHEHGFGGPVAKLFRVESIPQTFTIDAYGVLQDEQIGDAAIEFKLKKLVSQARELQPAATQGQ
jgi:thiol-disulfide isomerase/thioredoxin